MTDHDTKTQPTPNTTRDPDQDVNTPYARRIDPTRDAENPLRDQDRSAEDRQEALVDEAVEETFPASDPVSPKRIT